ncbi:MAG: 50S ribosomal protein L9 [Chloroflexota bacterium]|nr:50S ribosomal protein L9 [Chloroflexota bacterium]
MKIILTRDVPNLGHAGDVKDVATGYARNYLIPKRWATKATAGALKEFERQQASVARREERLAAHAEVLAQRLSSLTLTFEAKAGDKGRLYGSITPARIAEALEREIGEKFDRRKHIIAEPIRQVGQHVVPVRLTADVEATVKVVVKPEGGELSPVTPDESVDEPTPEDGQAEE